MHTDMVDMRINAEPTKDLFISTLIKDLPLIRSIIDLVDNSVDGARRISQKNDYGGLFVGLNIRDDRFEITDNCGGISVDLARHYAFRFGRPPEMEPTPYSVGQFGVGMKRALFKIGNHFRVESLTETSRFVVDVDVPEWKEIKDWKFEFAELDEDLEVPKEEQGTSIIVTQLHVSVAEDFGRENFRTRLANELREAQLINLERGLSISVNGVPLQSTPMQLRFSKDIKPVNKELRFQDGDDREVQINIYAGVGESIPREAGWYIFCNGRLLLGPEQSDISGWGEGGEKAVPRYHNQFAMFRGYIFFESDAVDLLPWNTTKTGVDVDSRIYKAARSEMINVMRPIISFLNQLDSEKDKEGDAETAPLHTAVKNANLREISTVPSSDKFSFKKPKPEPPPPDYTTIQYRKLRSQVDNAKKVLKVRSNREVGELSFEYFYERECEEV